MVDEEKTPSVQEHKAFALQFAQKPTKLVSDYYSFVFGLVVS